MAIKNVTRPRQITIDDPDYDEDDPSQNYTVGSDSNYEIVFCDATQLNGNIAIYYDTCEIDNANGSYRYATFRWEDKKLN